MILVLLLFVLLLIAGAHARDFRLTHSIDFVNWDNFIPSLIRVRDEIWNFQLACPPGDHRFIASVLVPVRPYETAQTTLYMALAYHRRAANLEEKNDEKEEKKIGNFYITQIGPDPSLPYVTPGDLRTSARRPNGAIDFSQNAFIAARNTLRASLAAKTWYDIIDSNFDIISYQDRNFIFDPVQTITNDNLHDMSDMKLNFNERRRPIIEQFALVIAESLRNHQVADLVAQHLASGGFGELDLTTVRLKIKDWDKSADKFFAAFQGAYRRTPELFVMRNLPTRSDSEAIDVEQCLSWHYWTILNATGTTSAPPVTPPTPFTSTPCGFLVRCEEKERETICREHEIDRRSMTVVDVLLSYIYFDTSNVHQGVRSQAHNAIALLSSGVINTMMHWIREHTNSRRSGGGGKKKGLSHSMQIMSQTTSPVAWSRPLWSTAFCITRNIDLNWSNRYAADVNGDGRMDVVFMNWVDNKCAYGGVLLSNGDGTFQDVWCFPFQTSVYGTALFIGDVNGDGKSDLILQRDTPHGSCTLTNAWYVYLGQSNGQFSSTANCDLLRNPAESGPSYFNRGTVVVTTIDMNNDGKTDLVFHTNGQNQCGTVLIAYSNQLNTASGPVFFMGDLQCIARFRGTASDMKVTPMDVNGDGITDLFFQVSTTYTEAPCPAGKGGVYLGELNQYGKTDFNTLVCMDWNMDPASVKITPVDVNADGKSDLLIQIKRSSTTVSQCRPGQGGIYLASNSERIFSSPVQCIPVGLDAEQVFVHVGDVNGDGWKDLVLRSHRTYYTLPECDSQHQGLMTMYGYGNGTFVQRDCKKYTYNAQATTGDVLIGDVNRDGRDDIVFRDGSDDCPDYIQRRVATHGLGVLLSAAGFDERLN